MPNIIAELKKRKVFNSAAIYLATAFVLLQAAQIIIPALKIPAWTISFLVVLAILGFPVVIIISWIYNIILRLLFKTNFRDISTGSRLISKKLVKKIKLTSNSPFIGAELAIKSKYAGFDVSEIGIHTYPRTFEAGSSVSVKNIILTIRDMIILFIRLNLKKIF